MIQLPPIAVLGAGAWGTALAVLLARHQQSVRLWDHATDRLDIMQIERQNPWSLPGIVFPKTLTIAKTLAEAVHGLDDICLVVPSHAFRTVLNHLKPLVSKRVRFVWGTKGLDPSSSEFLSDIVFQIFSKTTPVAVLSGPSFAKEVAQNAPTSVSLAGSHHDFLSSLAERFNNGHFRVFLNSDIKGVQLCGAVKNVMAIATGMVDGLGFGINTQSALITRGMTEMSQLCVALGGQAKTMMSLAGMGDVILTCTDNQSRNRRFGLAIGKGSTIETALKTIGESVEGYYNVKQLCMLGKKHKISMPITEQVYAILYEHRSPQRVLTELLTQEVTSE